LCSYNERNASSDHKDRNPVQAVDYLKKSCAANHGPSCYNLAVLYRNGDVGVEKNEKEFEKYKELTNVLVHQMGGLSGTKKG
jgi:TPR repeat protein